jgi:hypothetical protein
VVALSYCNVIKIVTTIFDEIDILFFEANVTGPYFCDQTYNFKNIILKNMGETDLYPRQRLWKGEEEFMCCSYEYISRCEYEFITLEQGAQ